MLREALADQLAEIEEQRREDITEAQAAAAEKRQLADEAYREDLAAAEENWREKTATEEANWQTFLTKTAENLADYAAKHNLSKEQVMSIWHALMGPGQEMDSLVGQAIARNEVQAALFEQAWTSALIDIRLEALATAAAIASLGTAGRGGSRPPGIPQHYPRGYQYGGEFIASQPTTIMVGEGYRPERVSIQPQSPIGGTMALSWRGGPIPVHGSGALEGQDLSTLGDSIAQGLVTELRGRILGYRGQRGG